MQSVAASPNRGREALLFLIVITAAYAPFRDSSRIFLQLFLATVEAPGPHIWSVIYRCFLAFSIVLIVSFCRRSFMRSIFVSASLMLLVTYYCGNKFHMFVQTNFTLRVYSVTIQILIRAESFLFRPYFIYLST